jgi:hypothetical protein
LNAIGFLCSLGPYLIVAWAYVKYVDQAGNFWIALGVLLGVRFFFSVIETLGSALAWRIYGRRHSVRTTVQFLIANKFPMRKYAWDNGENYLFRFRDKRELPEVSEETRGAARQLAGILDFLDEVTMVYAWRARDAFELALNIYAPPEKALYTDIKTARTGRIVGAGRRTPE